MLATQHDGDGAGLHLAPLPDWLVDLAHALVTTSPILERGRPRPGVEQRAVCGCVRRLYGSLSDGPTGRCPAHPAPRPPACAHHWELMPGSGGGTRGRTLSRCTRCGQAQVHWA